MLIPAMVGDMSSVHVPCANTPGKNAISPAPGTEAPPSPPEDVDQLAVLLQFPPSTETQYLLAPCVTLMLNTISTQPKRIFLINVKAVGKRPPN